MNDAGSVDVRLCEKHGIRYNAALQNGCVRCRKEAGDAGPSPRTSAAAGGDGSALPALLVTLLLILATGGALYGLHAMAYAGVESALDELEQPAREPSRFELLIEELDDQPPTGQGAGDDQP